jgi:NADP-dependent 3-hydroxy acid dehydrogenase YdfG
MPVTLITGASAGIGAALARELARRGHAVGLVARRADLLEALAAEIRAAGGTAMWVSADVTDRAQVEEATARVTAELGPIDLMVANAGTGLAARADRAPVDAWMSVLRLNIEGAIYSAAAVIPAMVARKGGHIAVVSSIAGFRGLPGNGAYSASKAAVSVFFEALRVDLARSGIAVTIIHPGFVRTPLTAKNRFPMPFLMESDRAARILADGLAARRSEINFPWPMVMVMRLARLLPNWLWDRVVRGVRLG